MYNQKRNSFSFDPEKTLEAILYISEKTQDLYHVLKILYFADKIHLSNYGRLIAGDSYVAMSNGPVPSHAYNIIKTVRGDESISYGIDLTNTFKVENKNNIIPIRKSNLEKLSDSDKECLDKSIIENKDLTFSQLKRKSHDKAYKSADENDLISLTEIAKSLDNNKEVLKYLEAMYE